MRYEIDLKPYREKKRFSLGEDFAGFSPEGETISFNNYFMEHNGSPFFAVSGEFHYSRMDPSRWEDELVKLRLGGVNIVSTYLFWNHIEEEEGVFDFTGRRDLRRFVDLCGRHGLWVILRVGPFDHGEVRNGGLPDWLFGKPFEVRHTNEGFMQYVRRLYTRIGEQVRGLFFRDGGPIIAVQLDNEYMHSSANWEMTTGISNEWIFAGNEGEAYILKLWEAALQSGLMPAFFTGTAWGGAAYSPRVLPLWGGYAYRPWIFYNHTGEHPATEEFVYEDYHRNGAKWTDDFAPAYAPEDRPYACCEMGAGMTCCYNYRFVYPFRSVDALANIKLGSGCNFIGYYMYHGGTNPIGRNGAWMNEAQVPKRSYDYQAAIGEYGQERESYRRLKTLHYFTRFFGRLLAPMETVLPEGASDIRPEDTETLRYAVRTDGNSGFLFLNNFQDHVQMKSKVRDTVEIRTGKETFLYQFSLAAEENAILPFNLDLDGILLKQANAQPVLRTVIGERITYVFMVPEGMTENFIFEEGTEILDCGEAADFARRMTVRSAGTTIDLLILDREKADNLYLLRDGSLVMTEAALLEDENGGLRLETVTADNTVRCIPAGRPCSGMLECRQISVPAHVIEPEVTSPAPMRYVIRLPENAMDGLKDLRLQIEYQGDIGSLFLENEMISDNFCNGDTWEIGLNEYREKLKHTPLVLRIAPLRKGARVNVESAMAARNEEVREVIGELTAVRCQPVYELKL